ncbi:8067_t:CDS:1, partial [Gigaspora rosea]
MYVCACDGKDFSIVLNAVVTELFTSKKFVEVLITWELVCVLSVGLLSG